MFKLSSGNIDQCPSQCDEKYRETQTVVGVQKKMINLFGRLINETYDVIEKMRNSEFKSDLEKYKDVSKLARDVFNIFTGIPKANRAIAKMMMKMLKDDKDDKGDGRPRPRPSHGPDEGGCSSWSIMDKLEYFDDKGTYTFVI